MKDKPINPIVSFLKYWVPPIIWAFIIFSFSSRPVVHASQINWQDFIIKKVGHIIEYAILATLFYRALKKFGVKGTKAGYYAILVTFLYGATDEFHQAFTPGRDSRIRDVIIDTFGAGLAIYSILDFLPKAPKKLKNWAEKLELI